MPREFKFLFIIILISVGILFIFVAWLRFKYLVLNIRSSTERKGTLVSFRHYSSALRLGNNYTDYLENGKGYVPVVTLQVNGKLLELAAEWSDYSLSKDDINKSVSVIYQHKFGLMLLINDEQSIHDYFQMKNILFWSGMSIGIILIIVAAIVLILL